MVPWTLFIVLPPLVMCWFNLLFIADERASGGFERDVLCSCEFIKPNGERGHILDFSDDFESVEEWVSRGCVLHSPETRALLSTLEHRIRIPWIGGSKKVHRQFYPLIIAPAMFIIGTFCTAANVIQFVLTSYIIGTLMIRQEYSSSANRGFLSNWLFVDHCLIFGVFLFEVTPHLPLVYSLICIFLVCMMLYLHMLVKTIEPGVIRPSLTEVLDKVGTSLSNTVDRPICTICKLERPERSKHCRTCDHCVAVFDHHCPVMDCCIGSGNHACFMLYLTLAIINATILLICYSNILGELPLSHYGSTAVSRCIMWSIPTSSLYLIQLYQVSVNLTTNERLNRENDHYEYLNTMRNGSIQTEAEGNSTYSRLPFFLLYRNWKDFVLGNREKRLN